MAGIIKNQILKHLSRFVKDLSSDRINVSTLKGEGELTDLKLDEEVLTELLALPIWMKIKYAHCNRARIMIQWTKLKSIPIRLILDTVEIQIEACEELRPVVTTAGGQMNLSAGKYGFVTKVVDGITVTVEAVDIKFFSKAFESKVQISRIRVESRSPQWKRVELTQTRLKDVEKGEVLTFKEIEWQTLRLEAQSTKERHLAPLRLLTNQARAQVTIKKKLIDCSVVGCRLKLILDDLLWVLTDSQILAAAHFMSSLSSLVKQATETTQNVKAARKLESLPEYRAQKTQAASAERLKPTDSARIFDAFDVKETSYHLICEKIDLHFCDDPGGGRSNHPDLRDGGAAQIQLTQFMIDFYPYHLAKADRRHWPRYSNNDLGYWFKESLSAFRSQVTEVLFPKSTATSSGHRKLSSDKRQSETLNTDCIVSTRLSEQLSRLMSTCVVLKIRDICLYKVTTCSREVPLPFLSSYLERPKDISAIHMEFTWFYYPGGVCFPLPSPKLYTQIHPLQVNMDICTVLWLNSFVTNLQNGMPPPDPAHQPDYVDIRVEIVMPKLVFEEKASHPSQKQRPQCLQVQAARVVVSNFRSNDTGSTAQLTDTIDAIRKLEQESTSATFRHPNIPQKFALHAKGLDKVRERREVTGSSYHEVTPHLTTDLLWTESRDVWFVSVDAVWADFYIEPKVKSENGEEGKRKFRSSTVTSQSETVMQPFIDSLPVQLWFHSEEKSFQNQDEALLKRKKDIQAILRVDRLCNMQLTHYQYLFLMRVAEAMSEMSVFLTFDTRNTFQLPIKDDSVQIIGCLPRLEISFIVPLTLSPPSEMQREDSSLNDLEDTLPAPVAIDEEKHHRRKNLEPQMVSHEWAGASVEPQMGSRQWADATVEPQMGYPELSSTMFDKIPVVTTDWNLAESPKRMSFDNFMPDSPEHFGKLSGNNSSGLPSMDSIKSSFTQGMKQGISSLVVSFSKPGGQSTPDSEVTSMWSTDSSENNFIQLESPDNELGDDSFREEVPDVEVAEEVVEDNSQSTGSFSIHNPYARDDNADMAVLTVCVEGIHLGQKSEGLQSSVNVCCRSLAAQEQLSVPWNEFQGNFASRSKKWKLENEGGIKTEWTSQKSAIKLRFSQTVDENKLKECLNSTEMLNAISLAKTTKNPRVNLIDRPGPDSPIRRAIVKSTNPNLKAEVDLGDERLQGKDDDDFITLHACTLKGLGEFFEDEIPPSVLPMQVFVTGAKVQVIEEKANGMPPTKISLTDGLLVTRDTTGVFNIKCQSSDVRDMENRFEDLNMECQRTTNDLFECKNRNRELEKKLNEMQDLQKAVIELKKQVSELQEDKSYLLSQLQVDKKKAQIVTGN